MDQTSFQKKLYEYAQWRRNIQQALERYLVWLRKHELDHTMDVNGLLGVIQHLVTDHISLAFVAEISRGKTELINALFFGENGVGLLPSSPELTTICPTELFYDEQEGSYLRLLEIESRREDTPLVALKHDKARWKHIELEPSSLERLLFAFQELTAVKMVSRDEAIELGLYEGSAADLKTHMDDLVEIPCWRYALVSFPHPLLQEGLMILDTPGLNALNSEPELTLNILPNMLSIIFVIATDNGMTQNDVALWNQHVKRSMHLQKQGVAVVINKIDHLRDESTSVAEYQNAIDSQLSSAAKILKIEEKTIFPVSAKQGLSAKIKGDMELFKSSRLATIEHYLSDTIIGQRQKTVMQNINGQIHASIAQSIAKVNNQYAEASKQFDELNQFDSDNTAMAEKLLEDTTAQQEVYFELLAEFKRSHASFCACYQTLLDSLFPGRIEQLMLASKRAVGKSLTTQTMRERIQDLFADLRKILEYSIDNALFCQKVTKSIYHKFQAYHGFNGNLPKQFRIELCQSALERLFAEGEEYCQSYRFVMTEQSKVVDNLYENLMGRIFDVMLATYADAEMCSKQLMQPLLTKVTEDKKHIESRMAVLNSSLKSRNNLKENLANLENQISMVTERHNELDSILKVLANEGLDLKL